MKIYNYKNIIILTVAIAVGFIIVSDVNAKVIINNNNTSIINNVSTEVSSGGEVYINGELVESNEQEGGTAEVDIYTEIDGEVVQDIHKEFVGNIDMEVTSEVQANGNKVDVETIISDDDGVVGELSTSTEIKIDDNSSTDKSMDDNLETTVSNTSIDFWQLFINFFKNIFSLF